MRSQLILSLTLGLGGCASLPQELGYTVTVRRTTSSGPRTIITGTARCGAHVATELAGVVTDPDEGAAAWLRRAAAACGGETSAVSALTPQVVGNVWQRDER